MTEHFNKLTPDEAERLAILMEECAEVQQVIGKILRHGYESRYRDGKSNREFLQEELGDIFCAVDLMIVADDVSGAEIVDNCLRKHKRIHLWTHHQILSKKKPDDYSR